MDIQIDPEENETHALMTMAGSFTGKQVLEVGCGDGRLTWRFAAEAGHVTAIDPDPARLQRALKDFPASLRGRVEFHNLGLEAFADRAQAAPFDLVLLSWSL
jgi:ubiquinone/menaquinone biosynthesis C-methylase UbiE